jgi:hypothetical protein
LSALTGLSGKAKVGVAAAGWLLLRPAGVVAGFEYLAELTLITMGLFWSLGSV